MDKVNLVRRECKEAMAVRDTKATSLGSLEARHKNLFNEASLLKVHVVEKDTSLAEKNTALEEAHARIAELFTPLTVATEGLAYNPPQAL